MTSPQTPNGFMPGVNCGCGFGVSGYDEAKNHEALSDHVCFSSHPPRPVRFHDNLFSLWGALIVAVLVAGAVHIITGDSLFR